jgi:hypothetical protein
MTGACSRISVVVLLPLDIRCEFVRAVCRYVITQHKFVPFVLAKVNP